MRSIPVSNLPRESSLLSRLFKRFQKIKKHWERREPLSDRVVLKYHRIFVLPTKNGLRFLLICSVLFLASVNYESNLGLFFCFLLFWVAIVSILPTYHNLAGLIVEARLSEPAFAGQDLYFKMELKNQSARTRETIRVRWKEGPRVSISLLPGESQMIGVPIPALHRGLFRPGKFRVYTQFPLGLFYAWVLVESPTECIVYPKPAQREGAFSHFLSRFYKEGETSQEGKEDFGGFRKYQPGDSLKHIAWKALARGDEVLTKEFVHPISKTLWFNWNKVSIPDKEERLSFLCRAILEAERMGHHYGLLMPTSKIEPHAGEPHKHRCLSALALFEEKNQ